MLLIYPSVQPIEQSYLVQSEKLAEFSVNRQQQHNQHDNNETSGQQQSGYKE